MAGRIPECKELRVVCGVLVLGMQCEGLDSEYTVTSSASYPTLEGWKYHSGTSMFKLSVNIDLNGYMVIIFNV